MIASQQSTLRVAGLTCTGILALLVGCRASLPDRGALRPGTYYQTTPVRYLLSVRTYLVHVPRNYSEERAWPLVLVLHGAFSTGDEIEKWSGFSDLADREGFVVAYPNGIGLFGFLQHWNAGHCCGRAEADNVDDVGFLNYVIRDISDKLRIDPKRLYVVGHSNGGMLAYYYAAELSARVAGIGVVAGAMGRSNGPREPVRKIEPAGPPVPLIAIHGREDEHVPFEGGSGLRSGKRRYVSAFDSAASWARYCGCEPAANVREDARSGRRVVTWRRPPGPHLGRSVRPRRLASRMAWNILCRSVAARPSAQDVRGIAGHLGILPQSHPAGRLTTIAQTREVRGLAVRAWPWRMGPISSARMEAV